MSKRMILWLVLCALVFVYVSPWLGVTMGLIPTLLYVGGWYVILRMLGIIGK